MLKNDDIKDVYRQAFPRIYMNRIDNLLANKRNDTYFLYALSTCQSWVIAYIQFDFSFGLISVLHPFNTFQVISGAVSYPNHTVPGQAS